MRRALTWLVFLGVLVWGTVLIAGIGVIQRDIYAPFVRASLVSAYKSQAQSASWPPVPE